MFSPSMLEGLVTGPILARIGDKATDGLQAPSQLRRRVVVAFVDFHGETCLRRIEMRDADSQSAAH